MDGFDTPLVRCDDIIRVRNSILHFPSPSPFFLVLLQRTMDIGRNQVPNLIVRQHPSTPHCKNCRYLLVNNMCPNPGFGNIFGAHTEPKVADPHDPNHVHRDPAAVVKGTIRLTTVEARGISRFGFHGVLRSKCDTFCSTLAGKAGMSHHQRLRKSFITKQ